MLAPGAVVLVLLIPVVGKVLDVVPAKYVIAAGGLALASSLFYSMHIVPQERLLSPRAATRRADRGVIAAVRADQFHRLRHLAEAAGAATPQPCSAWPATSIGGVGISISTALVTEHEQIAQQYLVPNLTQVNQPYNTALSQVEQGLINTGHSMAQAMASAPGRIFQTLQAQTAVIAYIEVFMITGLLALVMIPTALLMSGVKTKAGGAG